MAFQDYGFSLQEAFNKEKQETTEHYRDKLLLCKQQQDAIDKKHAEELEVSKILGKLAVIDELFPESALREEKEKLESKLVLAMAKASDLEVPTIDWFKLNEPQMFG